jgi:hypothetical protein
MKTASGDGKYVRHWKRQVRAGGALQLKSFKVWGCTEKFPLLPLSLKHASTSIAFLNS